MWQGEIVQQASTWTDIKYMAGMKIQNMISREQQGRQ